MTRPTSITTLIEKLAGQKIPLQRNIPLVRKKGFPAAGLGVSQLNEALLLCGLDRMSRSFFQFLVDGNTDYRVGSYFRSLKELQEAIDVFRKKGLFLYGNVKFAFKRLSRLSEPELEAALQPMEPRDEAALSSRHRPMVPIIEIPAEDTPYLGYLVRDELERQLRHAPKDPKLLREKKRMEATVKIGKKNHGAYLSSDHLDVYVATSMRERHEYLAVHQAVQEVFQSEPLRGLGLRWFDPTQAYCAERIDKGLSEALMLKRAKCTLYLAQESDTLGKDSELASTLAQGKPVIAFVPSIKNGEQKVFAKRLLDSVGRLYPEKDPDTILLEQLQVFEPEAAWRYKLVRSWLMDPRKMDGDKVRDRLASVIRKHYEKRAQILKEQHPLGIQVSLETGVANGVLVARSTGDCAELIYRIMTNTLEFDLETKKERGKEYLLLKERITKSIFRVMTGDEMLMNAFWNFYLEEV